MEGVPQNLQFQDHHWKATAGFSTQSQLVQYTVQLAQTSVSIEQRHSLHVRLIGRFHVATRLDFIHIIHKQCVQGICIEANHWNRASRTRPLHHPTLQTWCPKLYQLCRNTATIILAKTIPVRRPTITQGIIILLLLG